MGYPVGPQYSDCSNIDNAHRLQGKLLLIVGEMDTNVPPESTMRFADALIRANKDFDLLVIPNAGHGMGGAYGQRRMHDFFVRHLLAQEPPNRNAQPKADVSLRANTPTPSVVTAGAVFTSKDKVVQAAAVESPGPVLAVSAPAAGVF
jgi:dienelactone hydrolase